MNYDYAIHSDFLIHWTGKDIDLKHDPNWYNSDKSKTHRNSDVTDQYLARLKDILKYGLWMTSETESDLNFGSDKVTIPSTPKTCFTELKISQSRVHANRYGRLGIGLKRPYLFNRFGRPVAYFGFHEKIHNDKFLQTCAKDISDKNFLNFFKPMNSSNTLNYDFYSESEWRIILDNKLLSDKLIIDPRDPNNKLENEYFLSLDTDQQEKLKYLIPLDGWFAMIIYPSLSVKNRAQQDASTSIHHLINEIKSRNDHGNQVEHGNWPIEVDLDACRNF